VVVCTTTMSACSNRHTRIVLVSVRLFCSYKFAVTLYERIVAQLWANSLPVLSAAVHKGLTVAMRIACSHTYRDVKHAA